MRGAAIEWCSRARSLSLSPPTRARVMARGNVYVAAQCFFHGGDEGVPRLQGKAHGGFRQAMLLDLPDVRLIGKGDGGWAIG